MPLEQQVLVALFLRHQAAEQTISQYKLLESNELLPALIKFLESNHSDDEVNILDKIRNAITLRHLDEAITADILRSMDRALKMFYMQQQMSGNLKEFKEDYFN